MNLEQLKKGFFGYNKSSVYQYISSQEEEFSKKILEKAEEHKKIEEQYLEKIKQLEQELQETKQRVETLQNDQMMISAAWMEATRYAEQLKKEAEQQKEKDRQKWKQQVEKANKELEHYQARVKNVREMVTSLLHNLDEKSMNINTQIQTLQEECPSHNMALFERKNESEK